MTWGPPIWKPVDTGGTAWELHSCRGRYLGCIVKIGDIYLAEKFCCRRTREGLSMRSAAQFVLTVLECRDCLPRCLAPA